MNNEDHRSDAADAARDAALDASLRETVLADQFDSSIVERSVRLQVAAQRAAVRRGKWFLAATVATIAALIAIFVTRALTTPAIYAEAARDHRREVVGRELRTWAVDQAAIDALTERAGFTPPQVARLVPAGYKFDRGKLCRLEGKIYLHLVYSEGGREFSFFLRPSQAPNPTIDALQTHALCVTTLSTPSLAGLIVTDQPRESALILARFAANAR